MPKWVIFVSNLSICPLHSSLFSHPSSFSLLRAHSLCRSVLTCIYQLRGKIDYYFLFVYFTYFNNLLICLSIDFYVHLVIVSLPNCVCVWLCVKVYVSVCHCLLAAITRVWALQTAVCRRAFRTKKNARWKQSSAWLVGRSVTLSILISLVNRLRRRFLSLDYLLEFCVCFALVFIQLFVYIILYFITFS